MFWTIFFSIVFAAFVIKYVFPWLENKENRKKIFKWIGIVLATIVVIVFLFWAYEFLEKNLKKEDLINFVIAILILCGLYDPLIANGKENFRKLKKWIIKDRLIISIFIGFPFFLFSLLEYERKGSLFFC